MYVYKSISGKTLNIDSYVVTATAGLESKYEIEALDSLIGISINRYTDGVLDTEDNKKPAYINSAGNSILDNNNTAVAIGGNTHSHLFSATTSLTRYDETRNIDTVYGNKIFEFKPQVVNQTYSTTVYSTHGTYFKIPQWLEGENSTTGETIESRTINNTSIEVSIDAGTSWRPVTYIGQSYDFDTPVTDIIIANMSGVTVAQQVIFRFSRGGVQIPWLDLPIVEEPFQIEGVFVEYVAKCFGGSSMTNTSYRESFSYSGNIVGSISISPLNLSNGNIFSGNEVVDINSGSSQLTMQSNTATYTNIAARMPNFRVSDLFEQVFVEVYWKATIFKTATVAVPLP
jgi:hypothetical protein